MADADDIKEQEEPQEQEEQEEQKEPEAGKSAKKSLVARLVPWVIIIAVVGLCAGGGFSLGRLFAGSRMHQAADSDPNSAAASQVEDLKADNDSAKDSNKVWYYDLDPVIANLNEPTVTRYVRASLTLEMSSELDVKKGTEFLDEKKPILINWLTVYLSSLGLEDIRGDNNLRTIQSQIRDAFNEELFPDSKSQVLQVLIKEFPVQ
jgi:flagellar basal body-associated protein FliL